MEDQRPIVEARQEAKRFLREGFGPSLSLTAKVFVGIVTVLGILGGGLSALNSFNFKWLVWLCVVSILVSIIVFVGAELQRLATLSTIVSELLSNERRFESLLADARTERDQAQRARSELEAQFAMYQAAGDLAAQIRLTNRPHPAGPPQEDGADDG